MEHSISEHGVVWAGLGLAVSISAVLLSQFALDSAADSSTVIHWIQHGLLFGGGVGTGLALTAIRSAGQSRA